MSLWFNRIEIRSQPEHLPEVRRFVGDFCKRDICRPLAREDRWNLELAVHEAAANIIQHAYENRPDQPIRIEMEAFEERIMVRLNHWGKPFRPLKPASPPVLDGPAECGFGLYLIENCVDRVIYGCGPTGKSTITLLKHYERRHGYRNRTSTRKGAENMDFEIEKKGAVAIVLLPGETFEAAVVPDFNESISPVMAENTHVIFDLSNIRFLDSMGSGALLACHRKLKEKGGKMGLCRPQKQVMAIFELMGFPELFDVFNTREEALKAYR